MSNKLKRLIDFYMCNSAEQFFEEMMNCLETDGINESNYEQYLPSFERNHKAWVGSY